MIGGHSSSCQSSCRLRLHRKRRRRPISIGAAMVMKSMSGSTSASKPLNNTLRMPCNCSPRSTNLLFLRTQEGGHQPCRYHYSNNASTKTKRCYYSHLVPLATSAATLDSKLSRITLLLLCLGLTSSTSSVKSIMNEGGENSLSMVATVHLPNSFQDNFSKGSEGEIDGDDENDVELFQGTFDVLGKIAITDNENVQHAGTAPNLQSNPQIKLRPQTNERDNDRDGDLNESHDTEKAKDSVIILSAVDGTLAGVSRTSGHVLWRKSRVVPTVGEEGEGFEENKFPEEWNAFLSPLVSTTSKNLLSSSDKQRTTGHEYQWQAIPSIDGTVYLTGGDSSANNDGGGYRGQELSVSIHIRDLVNKAPFVDAQQRFFVGSRKAMVAALDEHTGEILRVIPKWKQDTGDDDEDDETDKLPSALEGRDVVWIGRLEHTVIVHDLRKSTVDVEISVSEILSVDEMIHGDRHTHGMSSSISIRDEKGDTEIIQQEEEINRIVTEFIADALRHPGDRILRLPAPESNDKERHEDAKRRPTLNSGSPFLVSTPKGNVAFRDDTDSTTVGWVSFDLLDSPVVYAIEASTGHKIRVNVLDDSSLPLSETKKNSLSEIPEQQIAALEIPLSSDMHKSCRDDESGDCRTVGFSAKGSVVGALQNGQIYALPLGERKSRPRFPLELPQPHSIASEMANVNNVDQFKQTILSTQHATIGFHEHRHGRSDDADLGDKQLIHLDDKSRHSCTPSSPLYPGCLIGASIMLGNLLDVDGNLDIASVFASSDLDYDLYLDMLEGNSRKTNSFFQRFVNIMSSWIAPLVALIFVVSFEIGRRERLKVEAKTDSSTLDSTENNGVATEEWKTSQNNPKIDGGVIQLSDEILGYGGHGTIVYKGVLDKRQVAVKRMLNMYHASADREISLLIESDGHPNVVRYFLKEMRGEFVYLALELCDMSLNDLIVALSKLRYMRKESIQPTNSFDGFESATKKLLLQIASGVRHLHNLRIVHRDLKPQNILLALRSKSKPVVEQGEPESEPDVDGNTSSTCIELNSVIESFKNQEYVPKISDMGLGKQLAGQSSFGLSTLGTGSVGGSLAGDAGAGVGVGSVGWQAPEVMAQRWSPESSSNTEASEILLEASPIESGINRTSRSVDIFSLGCIFFCTLLPGSHPFGEWYEREANIMKNTPNREDLELSVPPEARDLILMMINRDAKARPTADEVCEHPFFWSMPKRLKFLCDVSDRIESCSTLQGKYDGVNSASIIIAIEKGAVGIVGTSWEKKLDPELLDASLSRRTYDPSSLRDCLRMIRNKHHHYDELPASLKCRIGSNTDGLSIYVTKAFPRLLMHCYNFCVANLGADDSLLIDYKLPVSRNSRVKTNNNEKIKNTELTDFLESSKTMETIPDDELEHEHEEQGIEPKTADSSPKLEEEPGVTTSSPLIQHESQSMDDYSESNLLSEEKVSGDNLLQCGDDLSGIVVWSGSTAARELKCRGWYRSDDDWTQRLDAKLRKRDSNLARLVDDPKYRTRLCNYWDSSQGRHCPMRKKNKCIFAHGPIELRVKGGKHHRWGTLVNKLGLCANPKASGGEDTYGAARTIEKTRKEQGQWAVEPKQRKPPVGKTIQSKKKSPELT